ncbi:hypothetical protein NEF87_003443 [Candidatus Lokiarchaeum ossiferum]|uniref:LPXTG cell wall anchor domain-containing protein n=1 Tax=Candidatus Lokiarchaeum ossiferum TaxID=2951803 RepID=A0ABY6HUG0_9ARCH|nr:hypothetical protein NEF87_003443 [Candidatus Lokiarchaeum sp. B-35]
MVRVSIISNSNTSPQVPVGKQSTDDYFNTIPGYTGFLVGIITIMTCVAIILQKRVKREKLD